MCLSEIENFKPCLLEIENFEAESLLKNLKCEFPVSEKKEGTETPCFLEFHEGPMEIPEGAVVIDGDFQMLDREDADNLEKINECLDRLDSIFKDIKEKADKEKEEKRKETKEFITNIMRQCGASDYEIQEQMMFIDQEIDK